MRYVDEIPLSDCSTEGVESMLHSTMDLARFPVVTTDEMTATFITQREHCKIRFVESILKEEEVIRLDFDAFVESTQYGEILTVADMLHDTIRSEFESSIKQPVLDLMRQPVVASEQESGDRHE